MTSTRPMAIDLDLPDRQAEARRPPGPFWRTLEHNEEAVRWVSRAAWTVLLLALAVFLVRGANRAVRPRLIPPGGAVPSHTFPGFNEVAFSIGGPKVPPEAKGKHCALLANTEAQRERGLMNRQSLGGYEGMVFQFQAPTMTPFYMKDTLIPLSIAWFSPTGQWLGEKDMLPCTAGSSCPLFYPPAPYTAAIEVIQGYLNTLAAGPGTTMAVGGFCGA